MKKKNSRGKWIGGILFFLSICTILFFLLIILLFIDSYIKFPNLKQRVEANNYLQEYLLLDAQDTYIPQSVKYRKLPLEYVEIPKKVIDTLLLVEDKRFFNHYGLNLWATFKVVVLLPFFVLMNKRPQGASTITQQCIRTIFLDMSYSYVRKAREIILSIRLEKLVDKKTILNSYFNNIYFGCGNYGIKSAARYLLNKSLDNLNNQEIALLIALIKNPSLSLNHKYNMALERRNYVLDLMYQNHIIGEHEYVSSINSPISYRRENTNASYLYGQHFSEHTLKLAEKILEKTNTKTKEPIVIQTTLNNKMQKLAEKIILKKMDDLTNRVGEWHGNITSVPHLNLRKMSQSEKLNFLHIYGENRNFRKNLYVAMMLSKKKNLCLLDNGETVQLEIHRQKYNENIYKGDIFLVLQTKKKTYIPYQIPIFHCSFMLMDGEGRVQVMVGSNSYNSSSYNRAVKSKGPIGSVMKVFLLPFLLQKMEPNTLLDDSPIEVDNPPLEKWAPKNWDNKFNGAITLRNSVALSRNCSLVRAVINPPMSLQEFFKFCKEKLNLKDLYPSTILGSTNISLLELGKNLVPLTNGGYRKTIQFIDKISLSSNNNVLFKQVAERGERIYTPDILFQTYKILSSNKKTGISKSVNIKVHCACKSGTSNDRKRVVFIAYGKNWSMVCAIARDDYQDIKLMSNASSGAVVSAIINGFNQQKLMEFTSVDRPDNIYAILVDKNTGIPVNNGEENGEFPENKPNINNVIIEYLRKKNIDTPLNTTETNNNGN